MTIPCDFTIGCPEAINIRWVGWSEYREAVMASRIEEIARWRSDGFKKQKHRRKISHELTKASH